MRPRTIFSSQNDHQVYRRGAVVKVLLPLLRRENVPVTDAESGRGGRIFGVRHWDIRDQDRGERFRLCHQIFIHVMG